VKRFRDLRGERDWSGRVDGVGMEEVWGVSARGICVGRKDWGEGFEGSGKILRIWAHPALCAGPGYAGLRYRFGPSV
jgi:hypothetical protein